MAKRETADAIFGDGFVPYHLSVQIDNPERSKSTFDAAVQKVQSLKDWVRQDPQGIDPSTIESRLRGITNVVHVFHEGPYSSIAIPLCLVRSLGGQRAVLSGVKGQGPLADAIGIALSEREVEFNATVIKAGDSPIELSIRDNAGHHQTVRLYPVSRSRYRHKFVLSSANLSQAKGFILSRFNRGRAEALLAVSNRSQFTSVRISEPTRYVTLDDYLGLVPAASQIVVSHRGGVLKQLARRLECKPTDDEWTRHCNQDTETVASKLCQLAGDRALVVFVLAKEVVLFSTGQDALRFRPPPQYDDRSRAARLQGAFAAQALRVDSQPAERSDAWIRWAETAVQAAFEGTLKRPSTYPGSDFQPNGTWAVSAE